VAVIRNQRYGNDLIERVDGSSPSTQRLPALGQATQADRCRSIFLGHPGFKADGVSEFPPRTGETEISGEWHKMFRSYGNWHFSSFVVPKTEVTTFMSDRTPSSWFYPKTTGDPGRDRNARTLQVACFLLTFAVSLIAVLNTIAHEPQETPLLVFAAAGLAAAAVINRAGMPAWAARTVFLALLLAAILLVFEARDGFRSNAMLFFPGLLLLSVMLLDRASYWITASIVLLAVAALGIAEKHGLTHAIPHVRSSTNYDSIFFVDLALLVFAVIGSRIARDAQCNISDLRTIIDRLSGANLALTESTEALRQSEARYRRLYESIADGVVAVDLAGHILETNPAFESMLAYSGEEMRRLTYQEITPERWRAFEAQVVTEQVLTRGYSEVYEKEYRRRDGTVFPIEVRQYLLRNENDQPVGIWAIIRDITGRKRDERALSEGDQRLQIAKDAAKLGIYQYDITTGKILWDARVRQFWGLGPDVPITIDTFFSGLHPDDRARTQILLERALDPARDGDYYAEYRVISDSDGSERWIAASGKVFFENGRPTHMIGTGQDISERKRAEAALRESEERFRRVFEEGPLGLALVGRDYRFLKVNSALCQMVGYSEEELVRKNFGDITHPEDLRADVELAERLFRREIPFYRMQKRYVKKNGEILWINLTASILFNLEGQPLYGVAMVEDITEVKRTQEEAFARQKLESVGTLAGGIAHDFNNLLGAIEAQAELALVDLNAGSSSQEELKTICGLATRGSEIVRQLMIYAGKESEVAELIDLSEIVEEMLPLLKVSLSKHALLTSELDQDLPLTRATAAQFRQILMNLVTNASDAIGDQEGVIRVKTRRVRVAEESGAVSQTLPKGDCLALEVSDTGAGMTLETQSKVFDPFFTTKSVGRGLGLAVVQGIVRNLGGTIHVASEPGEGTTFRILLPCTLAATTETASPVGSAARRTNESLPATVLIVEDEDSLRQAVAKVLRKIGTEVFEAADGSTAIDLLRAKGSQIDAILLDLTIPGPSSQEVLAEATRAWPNSKVIITSAYSEGMAAASMTAPIVRGFIRKPFRLWDLVQTLRNALSS
jgi:PAS domain S-box-containing protein